MRTAINARATIRAGVNVRVLRVVVMEAIALTMKFHVDAMCAELGIILDDIVVSGGGSGSDLFMGILADVFGVPTARNVGGGGAALGAAICAAVAADVHADFETAVAAMSNPRQSFAPDHDRADIYLRMSDTVYQDIRSHTDALFERSYPIFH